MKKFKVQITETLQRIVEIEAEDKYEAWDKVYDQVEKEKIVLDWEDFYTIEIEVI